MGDHLQTRLSEALGYLGGFEEGLSRLSQDPNNTELQGEIVGFWGPVRITCDAIGCPDLADCSDRIQAALEEIREGAAATEEAIAQLRKNVAGSRQRRWRAGHDG